MHQEVKKKLSTRIRSYSTMKTLPKGPYNREGWLMFSEGGRRLLVIQQSKREPLLNQYHNGPLGGHMSSRKTESKLRQKYYWPGMAEEIKKMGTTMPDMRVKNKYGT